MTACQWISLLASHVKRDMSCLAAAAAAAVVADVDNWWWLRATFAPCALMTQPHDSKLKTPGKVLFTWDVTRTLVDSRTVNHLSVCYLLTCEVNL